MLYIPLSFPVLAYCQGDVMSNLSQQEDPCLGWELYPSGTKSSKLDSEEVDRYRHRLIEDSPRLFEPFANSFVLLRLGVEIKCGKIT